MVSCTRLSTVWPSTPKELIQKNFKTAKPTKREKTDKYDIQIIQGIFLYDAFSGKIYYFSDKNVILD